MDKKMKNRTAPTGANRNPDNGKFDYEGFSNPICEYSFAKYMHGHRLLEDGTMRDSDNWQKGLPNDWLIKSLHRHFMDLWLLSRGFIVVKRKDESGEHTLVYSGTTPTLNNDEHLVTIEEACNGVRFNSEGLKYNYLTND